MQGNVFWEVFSMSSFKRVITKQKLTIGLKDNDLEYIKQTQIQNFKALFTFTLAVLTETVFTLFHLHEKKV